MTRSQLRLVEAAHILPAAAEGSIDHVVNGIALSPTYHRAFDSGLIYIDNEFNMQVNPKKLSDLEILNLGGGIDQFRSPLGRIHLPADRGQWPDIRIVSRANKFRGISN